MTGLPVRLQLALAKARLFHGAAPIRYLRPDEILHSELQQPVSHDAMQEVIRDRESIVWIAGDESGQEPLAHAGIAHLAKLILGSGHFLFLETNAMALRQRIHEFQPCGKFYFVIRFLGQESEHDLRIGSRGAYAAAREGIRAAQLSGFYVCAKVESAVAQGAGLTGLCADLQPLDLDGVMISSRHDKAALRVSSGWNQFLQVVESARPECFASLPPVGEPSPRVKNSSDASCEEVAQV